MSRRFDPTKNSVPDEAFIQKKRELESGIYTNGLAGRPKVTIDWDEVDKLLIAGCNGTEIAGYLDMNPMTFYNRVRNELGVEFTQYRQSKRSKGNALLRSKQMSVAMKGDKGMLIWLGRNRLKQSENSLQPEAFNGQLCKTLDHLKEVKSPDGFKDLPALKRYEDDDEPFDDDIDDED